MSNLETNLKKKITKIKKKNITMLSQHNPLRQAQTALRNIKKQQNDYPLISTLKKKIENENLHPCPCLKEMLRASLVAQWLGVCLLMRGARVRALVWEDPACRGAAGPVCHDC